MNFRNMPEKLVKISLAVVVISLICGAALCLYIVIGIFNMQEINVDGSDLSPFFQIIGFISLPVLLGFIFLICIAISVIIDGAIWIVYGICKLTKKLIRERRWKTLVIIGAAVICIMLSPIAVEMINTPILDGDTIGYMAYDYNPNPGYTIHIKENGKYTPYLVLTYNYSGTGNALCLRENVVGGEGYIEDYNGTIAKSKVYDGWLEMEKFAGYEETEADRFLTGDFLRRIDEELLNKIYDTQLRFSEYEISRKFFLLSRTDIDGEKCHDNQAENIKQLKYFYDAGNRAAVNDAGVESPYWTRTTGGSFYFMVGYTGGIETTGDDAKLGVRPAFTIANDTNVTKIYDSDLMQETYILDV